MTNCDDFSTIVVLLVRRKREERRVLWMITPNIDALSLSELKYIAHKHGVDDAHTLNRDELIDALDEIYEELEEEILNGDSAQSPSSQQRFMNSLVEFNIEDLNLLPGVQPVAETYCETHIHLIFKDPYWAHAYWNLCKSDLENLEQTVGLFTFFITVHIHECTKSKQSADSFEIDVDKSDISWNINLPLQGRTYSVTLSWRDEAGNSGPLCHSNSISTPKSYWLEHAKTLGYDKREFALLFSSLVTKGGAMIESPVLKELVESIDKEMGGSFGN